MSSSHIPRTLRTQVEQDGKQRCGYCLSQRLILGRPLSIDHIIPESKGGKTEQENLWIACRRCNEFKGDQTEKYDFISDEIVPLFNPRTQTWSEHFGWSENGTEIVAKSAVGRITVIALNLNNDDIKRAREIWVLTGLHPPDL